MANTVTCIDCGMSEELDNDNGLVYLSRKYNCYLDQVCEVNRRIKDGEITMDSNGHLVYVDKDSEEDPDENWCGPRVYPWI